MKLSDKGKELLINLEGLIKFEYLDSGGASTIGVGHLLTKSERASGKILINDQAIAYCNGLTLEECHVLLMQDMYLAESTINAVKLVKLTQNQFDTLVCFVFNVGETAFIKSTLLKLLNQGQYDQIPTQLRRWIYDNGEIIKGLVYRREKEIRFWNNEI